MVKYWLWLTNLRGLGVAKILWLLERFATPEQVYFAAKNDIDECPELTEADRRAILDKSLDRAEHILEQCDMTGQRIITLQDAEYPERLRNIPDPPCVLYVKGRLPAVQEEVALAVVGTRKSTAYGMNVASRFGYHLAKNGMLIVSGMAEGIDSASQVGALRAGAPVVAVLGCGADVIYPSHNRALYEDIVATGAVLSEYAPGSPPDRVNFPRRNRIISGLALGVLVVEAPLRSGALITAHLAADQGRDVFAVPGPIDTGNSQGCHQLIQEGAALVWRPEDILTEYASRYPAKIAVRIGQTPVIHGYRAVVPAKKPAEATVSAKQSLEAAPAGPPDARRYDQEPEPSKSILVALCEGMKNADELGRETGLPPADVLVTLTTLEIEGKIRAMPGSRYALELE